MPCSLEEERRRWFPRCGTLAGVDEAGRGCLAGPVVAAAVILHPSVKLPGLDDSKKLSAIARERLFEIIVSDTRNCWATGLVDAREIDQINILEAARQAMRHAVLALRPLPDHALIDGLAVPHFPIPLTALVRGDSLSPSIAAASILAKVTRDRLMLSYDQQYPQYGFASHKGYATVVHRASLAKYGPCPIHRLTFAPVAQLELALD